MNSDRNICAICQRGWAGIVVAAMMAAALAGCGGARPDLTVTSVANHQMYHEVFTRAYASRRNGDLEIVLADDAAVAALTGRPTGSPIRQILHVHVLWHPDHNLASGTLSATNATLHWYVFGDPAVRPGDVLEYTGTAFVVTDGDPDSPTITIQNATLKPAYQHGLSDPVGSSELAGTVTATTNDQRVAQLLHEVESAAASSANVTTSPAEPTADVGQ